MDYVGLSRLCKMVSSSPMNLQAIYFAINDALIESPYHRILTSSHGRRKLALYQYLNIVANGKADWRLDLAYFRSDGASFTRIFHRSRFMAKGSAHASICIVDQHTIPYFLEPYLLLCAIICRTHASIILGKAFPQPPIGAVDAGS